MSAKTTPFSRRAFLRFVALGGAGAGLAACGQAPPAAEAPTAAPAAASTAAPAAASTAAPAAAGAPAGSISYWHHFTSDTEMRGLERIQAAFGSAYPQVSLSPENIPNADYMAKVTAAVQGNGRPDTAMAAAERVGDLTAMGGLVDLTARIDGWERKADFPDNRWTGITVDGKIYGVPAFMFVNWMYYRKDWFEEAGIAQPPSTWAEFQEAAIKISDPAQNRYGFGLRGGGGGQGYIIDVMESFGAQFVGPDGQPALDPAVAAEGIRFLAELYTTHKAAPPSAPDDSFRQIMEAFKTGQTGMVLHHTGSLKEIVDALGDKVATAPIPAGPAAHVARVQPLYNGLMREDNADAAWAWITFWGEPDASIALLEETGYFPASTVVAADPRVTGNPRYAPAVATLEFGSLSPQFPGFAGWGQNVVLPAFQRVLLGQATPEQAAEEMVAELAKAVG
jgi:multiple sugar transport system substrate-binding protein